MFVQTKSYLLSIGLSAYALFLITRTQKTIYLALCLVPALFLVNCYIQSSHRGALHFPRNLSSIFCALIVFHFLKSLCFAILFAEMFT